jgi:hypothetical protein
MASIFPEVSGHKDQAGAKKIIRESAYLSSENRRLKTRQLVSLAAASQSMSVSRTFKKKKNFGVVFRISV